MRMLDDVAAVDDAAGALGQHGLRALEEGAVIDPSAAAHENGGGGGSLDVEMVVVDVVGGIGLDEVCTELAGLTDAGDDAARVAVESVAALDGGCRYRERSGQDRTPVTPLDHAESEGS